MLLKKAILTLVLASLLQGCMNLYIRCPGHPYVEMPYQSTSAMANLTVVAAFPQILPMNETDGFVWQNCLTIPLLGLPCAIDTCLEAVVDTVCLPYDLSVSKSKEKSNLTVIEDHESDSGKGR
jgi:uncharacterized protein YceK